MGLSRMAFDLAHVISKSKQYIGLIIEYAALWSMV